MTAKIRQLCGLIPLLVIATTQLMLVLDDSIVNIALPSIQRELEVKVLHLPWVVNAYILAFGSLLLRAGVSATCGVGGGPCSSESQSSYSALWLEDSGRTQKCS